eukprot:TRINITY_DN355_c0_g1_i4.p1 TRINITY_DN355_c0_g1~~TRINITY_DN355_c0_g1_i4.p1  ORF type:complete len:144 (+),score=37.84 TRINITY_DN355_c0_g1_i4:145-576(+)
MRGDIRITYRRRNTHNTPSNKLKIFKTPGGRLQVHQLAKKVGYIKCGDCKEILPGFPRVTTKALSKLPAHKRHKRRAYGGSKCANCVKDRIVRAFLIEEHKIVKKVSRGRKKSTGAAAPKKAEKKQVKKTSKKSEKSASKSKK